MFRMAQVKALRSRRGVALVGIHLIFPEYRPVVITMPEVGYAYGAFRDVHAFVPVFFHRNVRCPERYAWMPTKDFPHDCAHVWKMRSVSKGRDTIAVDHGIYFCLCPPLHFWEGNHSKCPPGKGGSGCFCTCGTVVHRIIRSRIGFVL